MVKTEQFFVGPQTMGHKSCHNKFRPVLTFIGNRQTGTLTDKPNISINYIVYRLKTSELEKKDI